MGGKPQAYVHATLRAINNLCIRPIMTIPHMCLIALLRDGLERQVKADGGKKWERKRKADVDIVELRGARLTNRGTEGSKAH